MKIKPLFDKVVIKELPEEVTNRNGILLPTSSKEKQDIATVVAVGNGGVIDGEKVEMVVKVGDKVLFSKYAGNKFKMDDEELTIIRQSDILAIVE